MRDCPLTDGFRAVEKQIEVEFDLFAKPVAMRTHSFGMVKRKVKRRSDKRFAEPRKQQPQVSIYLGSCANGALQVVAHSLLVYDNCSVEIENVVHIGTRQFRHPRAGKRAERFDQLTLRLSVNCIEQQPLFSRTRHSRKHHLPVFRYFNVNVFQVIGVSIFDDDFISVHILKL